MNRTAILYSRSIFGLDLRIWTMLLIVVFASILLLGFKILNRTSCGPVSLLTQGTIAHKSNSVFYVNESITFTAKAGKGDKVQWSFDDGSPLSSGFEKKHSFTDEGDFMVTAIINGKCREIVPVTIIQRGSDSKVLIEESQRQSPIVGKTFATAGVPETYTTNVQANKYKWIVENNTNFEEKLGKSVSFSFSDTGTYNLTLELDDDLRKSWKQIVVVRSASANEKLSDPSLIPPPNPVPIIRPEPDKKEDQVKVTAPDNTAPPLTDPVPLPTKPAKKYLQIARPELESMLKDVVEKKRNVPDFENILCEGGNTKVTANDKTMTFAELCKKLQDRKGIFKSKVKDVKITSSPYDPDTKCLITIYVEFK